MSKRHTTSSASDADQAPKCVRSDGGSWAATTSTRNPYIDTEAEEGHGDEDADENEFLDDQEESDGNPSVRSASITSLHRRPTARPKNPYIDAEAGEGFEDEDRDDHDSLFDSEEEDRPPNIL